MMMYDDDDVCMYAPLAPLQEGSVVQLAGSAVRMIFVLCYVMYV